VRVASGPGPLTGAPSRSLTFHRWGVPLSLMAYQLGVIGGGNMGSAIVRGCLSARVFAAESVMVAEVVADRRRELSALGVATTGQARLAAEAEQIILAVKPQAFFEVARSIAPAVKSKVAISIMAGLSSPMIREALGGAARIVRTMPNVACQIGAGMTAIAPGAGAQPGDERTALAIFSALGKTAMVDEALMYAATAVSASGPAYVFLLAEAMEQAATRLGFDAATAKLLVTQTIMGAGRLLNEAGRSAGELRQAVTSPGGTTAAALDVMRAGQFERIVIEALTAARDRGRELDQA